MTGKTTVNDLDEEWDDAVDALGDACDSFGGDMETQERGFGKEVACNFHNTRITFAKNVGGGRDTQVELHTRNPRSDYGGGPYASTHSSEFVDPERITINPNDGLHLLSVSDGDSTGTAKALTTYPTDR